MNIHKFASLGCLNENIPTILLFEIKRNDVREENGCVAAMRGSPGVRFATPSFPDKCTYPQRAKTAAGTAPG